MGSDKDDLAILCLDMTKEEVDRVHRLLHEWSVGPEDAFPVQLVLLTRAQLRAAASVPRALADSRKWLEQHLAEYQRHGRTTLDEFLGLLKQQLADFKTTSENQAKANQQAANSIRTRISEAETVAENIKSLLGTAASELQGIKASAKAECDRLQTVSNDLQNRFAWQTILWWGVCLLLAFGLGYSYALNEISPHSIPPMHSH
jgi:DNA repair exonuclease SbcCD ATPase subunit